MNYSAHNPQTRETMNAFAEAIKELIDGADISTAIAKTKGLEPPSGWPCDNCDACFEILNSAQIINDFISGIIDRTGLIGRKLSWDRSLYADKALLGLGDLSRLVFAREKHSFAGDLIYLDHNVFSCARNDSRIRENLLNLRKR